MYLDLLGADKYINMNIRLAQFTDVKTAIYFAELLNIISQVVRKTTFDSEGYFTLNRKYMTDRTTLLAEEQVECENKLSVFGLISVKDKNKLAVNLEAYFKLLIDDVHVPSAAERELAAKEEKKRLAAEKRHLGQIEVMCKAVDKFDIPDILKSSLHDWVDSIYSKPGGFLTARVIEVFINDLYQFSGNETTLLDLVKIATVQGWSNPEWVINSYVKSTTNGVYKKPIETKVDSPVKLDLSKAF